MSGRGVASPVPRPESVGKERLHYLDWLRVTLILGVFLYHALHPFDETIDWHIKNDSRAW